MMLSLNDPEIMLFDAIFNGNLIRVKRLIGSGISKNAILHSPTRWEGATVLGTAAYSGNLDIVKFLVRSGASVNFQDPLLGRTALHWACMWPGADSGADVVEVLLIAGANINYTDRDNMTPLLQAAMNKNSSAVKVLLEHGADVNQVDRLKCSALHYAAFNGASKSCSEIIRAGCVQNHWAIFGKGTPLANLVHHDDVDNCRLLLAAGYSLGSDRHWLTCTQDTPSSELLVLIKDCLCKPASLKALCRIKIRNSLNFNAVNSKQLHTLPVPLRMMSYLALEYLD
ncbi:ankyrin repeat and SOCS box protein 8-like [Gigantopelta aegis]|uniref:ankyrin repeat and SOCS box protein 8-like n=1 Tax=Gigantopelta aegis TaxID=1735272 RepID=UPI001B889CFE|nr:ankyrin repeat and SOCS box protein 8-like [Gigantopelta aegis]XP_041360563.1 ankyrin repeat and SOCS box protein 8-like [Gigantopelta aegis]